MVDEERVTRLAGGVLDDVRRLRDLSTAPGLGDDVDRLDAVVAFVDRVDDLEAFIKAVLAWSTGSMS